MLKDRRHDYRLANSPPEFFVQSLECALLTAPEILEAGSGPENRKLQERIIVYELFDQESGPFYFTVSAVKSDGVPDQADLAMIRAVLASIIVLDDEARAIPCEHDENEELFDIRIDAERRTAILSYSSTFWNTEWEVRFRIPDGDRFECLGIPDWKSPGQFIR